MQVKLLHDLVEEMAGVGTGRIVEILFGKKDVNEFLIAKKMVLTINQVRNILYKLSADGLVTFIRKKDKRKGWYIYYWTLKTEKCLVKLEQSLMKKIEELNSVLNGRETRRFYVCKPCGIEVTEDKALDNGFTCEECAEVHELSDNSNSIRDTKSKITKVEKDLKLIQDELVTIRAKDSKKRVRVEAKEAKDAKSKKDSIKAAKVAAKVATKKLVVKAPKVAKSVVVKAKKSLSKPKVSLSKPKKLVKLKK